MSAYENTLPRQGAMRDVKILADLRKIDAALTARGVRWPPDLAQATSAALDTHKLHDVLDDIDANKPVHMPWLLASERGDLDISDGRHTLYALRLRGFDQVWITCKPEVEENVRAIVC